MARWIFLSPHFDDVVLSQIILFWPDENEMRAAIASYFKSGHGYTLWRF